LAFAGLLTKGQKKHALTWGYIKAGPRLAHGLLPHSLLLAFSPFIGKGQRPNQGQGQNKMVNTPCPKCSRPTYKAVAGTVAAFYARIDADPITYETELACLIVNIRTYTRDNRNKLNYRRPAAIIYKPAYWPTHAEHDCTRQLPTIQQPAGNIDVTDTNVCPF
jgi:hypothetical protein